jgi:hypothetical protein
MGVSLLGVTLNQRVISILLVALAILVFISLSLSFMAVLGLINALPFIDQNHLTLLPGISIGCGGMIAILAFVRDRLHQKNDRIRKSDEIYLSIARDSFNEVYDLLKDKNNDRIIWVRSARLLLQALALKSKIETKDIIEAFQVSEERLRTELYRTFSITVDGDKNKQALPPQFFYGIDDWKTEKNLDEAAIKGGSTTVCVSVNIDENIPSCSSGSLANRSVIAIFDFLEFPSTYDDPLKKVQDWDDEWADSHGINQGAKRYIAHTKSNFVIGGKLHKKD